MYRRTVVEQTLIVADAGEEQALDILPIATVIGTLNLPDHTEHLLPRAELEAAVLIGKVAYVDEFHSSGRIANYTEGEGGDILSFQQPDHSCS